MFRCPGCAKVYKVPLGENYSVLSNKDMTKFHVVKEPFYKDGNLAKAFASMLLEVTDFDQAIFFVQEKEQKVIDMHQTCPACQETHSLEDWIAAWEMPMDFFDAEQLCGCGEEMWMDRIPYTNRYGLVCDSCGWIKPASSVSGSADATTR